MNPVGCNREQLKDILSFCGFKFIKLLSDRYLYYYEPKNTSVKSKRPRSKKINLAKKTKIKKISNKNKKLADPDSPFAVLEKLL